MHLMSWEREKKRKGLWGTICDDTARKGVQNPGGSAAADSSNSANTHTCKAKKVQIVIVIPSSLPPGSTPPPPPTPTPVMSSLLYPPLVQRRAGRSRFTDRWYPFYQMPLCPGYKWRTAVVLHPPSPSVARTRPGGDHVVSFWGVLENALLTSPRGWCCVSWRIRHRIKALG